MHYDIIRSITRRVRRDDAELDGSTNTKSTLQVLTIRPFFFFFVKHSSRRDERLLSRRRPRFPFESTSVVEEANAIRRPGDRSCVLERQKQHRPWSVALAARRGAVRCGESNRIELSRVESSWVESSRPKRTDTCTIRKLDPFR